MLVYQNVNQFPSSKLRNYQRAFKDDVQGPVRLYLFLAWSLIPGYDIEWTGQLVEGNPPASAGDPSSLKWLVYWPAFFTDFFLRVKAKVSGKYTSLYWQP